MRPIGTSSLFSSSKLEIKILGTCRNVRTRTVDLSTVLLGYHPPNSFIIFQEISSQTPAVTTPPLQSIKSPSPSPPKPLEVPKEVPKQPEEPQELPQIELKLPKRPIRERLGAREEPKKTVEKKVPERKAQEEQKKAESPERLLH